MANVPSTLGRRGSPTAGDTSADGYVYFNNDHRGCALRDAAMFARLLAVNNVETGRRPDPGDPVLAAAADADPRTGVMPL